MASEAKPQLQTRRYVVRGRVQGVGFRWFVEREAQKFDESSSVLSKEMITMSKRIYWLTWLIALLTVAILILTAWMGLSSIK